MIMKDDEDREVYLFCPLGQSPDVKKLDYTLALLNSDCIVLDKWCIFMEDDTGPYYKCAIRWWVHKLIDVNENQKTIMEKFDDFKNEIVG